MTGIADALAKNGSPLDLHDIFLWNTMYDSWCFFAHPNSANQSQAFERDTVSCRLFQLFCMGRSDRDGSLIFGKNMDNLNLPGILEGRMLVICDPDNGFGHANITHPGMIAIDGGLNESGVAMMTQYSPSIYETMRGCGIGTLSRLVLQNASRVEDALDILTVYPHCTGINYHVADAKAQRAMVIETNAKQVAFRKPYEKAVLWTTNHYNCYPGWMGYQGENLVEGQQPAFRLKDVSSIAAWQESLQEKSNPYISAAGRFRQYENY